MLILEAERDTLLKPLQAVTGIVERKHTLPILSNVLIERTGGHRRARAGGRPRTSHNSNSEGTVMRDNHETPAHQRSSSARGALR